MNKDDRDSFILLKGDVEHIKTDVKETKATVDKFYGSMIRIEQKLFNDDTTGEKGIVFQVGENTLKLKSIYIKIAVAIGISNGIGIVLGAVFL
jgi:hypothetical protein